MFNRIVAMVLLLFTSIIIFSNSLLIKMKNSTTQEQLDIVFSVILLMHKTF